MKYSFFPKRKGRAQQDVAHGPLALLDLLHLFAKIEDCSGRSH
jgi:hypothetical protein